MNLFFNVVSVICYFFTVALGLAAQVMILNHINATPMMWVCTLTGYVFLLGVFLAGLGAKATE